MQNRKPTGILDVNGEMIHFGDTVKHQQASGGILPPAEPVTGIIVPLPFGGIYHGDPSIEYKNEKFQDGVSYIYLNECHINEIIKDHE